MAPVIQPVQAPASLESGPCAAANASDAQSEVMSTSTVSKAEEGSRMADIESVWEEKYQKLKKLTIKMKQKTLDQQATIKKLEVRRKHYVFD